MRHTIALVQFVQCEPNRVYKLGCTYVYSHTSRIPAAMRRSRIQFRVNKDPLFPLSIVVRSLENDERTGAEPVPIPTHRTYHRVFVFHVRISVNVGNAIARTYGCVYGNIDESIRKLLELAKNTRRGEPNVV